MKASTPLGYRLDGTPFYGFSGAQDDEAPTETTQETPPAETDDGTDADGLTPGGRAAIQREREAANTAKRALGPWKRIEREFQMSPEQIAEKLRSLDSDTDRVRREAAMEATQKFQSRIVQTEVRSLARETFADPEDALVFLKVDDVDVDDDGNVNTDQVKKLLAGILKAKPHLAKPKPVEQDDTVRDFDGGARANPPKGISPMEQIREMANAKRGRR